MTTSCEGGGESQREPWEETESVRDSLEGGSRAGGTAGLEGGREKAGTMEQETRR